MPNLFPLFINLEGKKCVVAGFGKVGRRKTANLLEASPASILVLDPLPAEKLPLEASALIKKPVHYESREWKETDLDGSFLVFACTGSQKTNKIIADSCSARNMLCNCATPPSAGNCMVPARSRTGLLHIAFSTSGASPALAAKIRDEFGNIAQKYENLALFMLLLRNEVLESSGDSCANKTIFQNLLNSNFPKWLDEGRQEMCADWIMEHVPSLTPEQIGQILQNFCNKK